MQGVQDSAEDNNVVVEYNAHSFNNPEEELQFKDIAII